MSARQNKKYNKNHERGVKIRNYRGGGGGKVRENIWERERESE